jgi:transcriptional regulator with XRE-family HTH domain
MVFGSGPEATQFRGLVLVLRARTGLLQRELAAAVGVTERTVQTWEAGSNYPNAERLKRLISVCLRRGAFVPGREHDQAVELWDAALREAPRLNVPFDHDWFTETLAAAGAGGTVTAVATVSAPSASSSPVAIASDRPRQDWGEAPDAVPLHGRANELETLRTWLLDDGCRLVVVLGLGGIGKTALAASLARRLADSFDRVCWRSLRNAPPTGEWMGETIGFLSAYKVVPPESMQERLNDLLELLRARRCLLVLDNFETVLRPGAPEGGYLEACQGYGQVLRRLGQSAHQSCVLVTSREKPPELAPLEGERAPVRSFRLTGLGPADARRMLEDKRLVGDEEAWHALVGRYRGNPLALKVVSETIGEVMGSEIATFLSEAGASFGGIRRLLDGQIDRLSNVERRLLTWLAVEREPIGFAALALDLGPAVGRNEALEALEAVSRRSLLEQGERGTVTLQPVVLEYLTDHLVEEVAAELASGHAIVLVSHALVKATASDDVRRSQERLIGVPLLAQVVAIAGDPTAAERRLLALLEGWRGRPPAEQGYGPGNVVNLLRLLRGDLRGLELSGLSIRQAYLQEVDAQDANLADARLTECVLADAFDYSVCVALDREGALLAAGTASGEVRVWRVAGRTPLMDLQAQGGGVYGIALTPDGHSIASGSVDGVVRLWDAASGRCLATLEGHADTVHAVALAADGGRVASASFDGTVRIWGSASGQPLAVLAGHRGLVWGVALSGDGRLVASCGYDGTVRVWDADGACLAVLEGHAGGVWCVALSGDGKLAVSGGLDGTVRIWDVESRRERYSLQGHKDMVWGVSISSDGRTAASGSYDGTVRVWDTVTGQGRAVLLGHLGGVRGVALSRDGRLLASGSFDGRFGSGRPRRARASPFCRATPAWSGG